MASPCRRARLALHGQNKDAEATGMFRVRAEVRSVEEAARGCEPKPGAGPRPRRTWARPARRGHGHGRPGLGAKAGPGRDAARVARRKAEDSKERRRNTAPSSVCGAGVCAKSAYAVRKREGEPGQALRSEETTSSTLNAALAPAPRPSARYRWRASRRHPGARAGSTRAVAAGGAESLCSPTCAGTRSLRPPACLSSRSQPLPVSEILVFLMSCLPADN